MLQLLHVFFMAFFPLPSSVSPARTRFFMFTLLLACFILRCSFGDVTTFYGDLQDFLAGNIVKITTPIMRLVSLLTLETRDASTRGISFLLGHKKDRTQNPSDNMSSQIQPTLGIIWAPMQIQPTSGIIWAPNNADYSSSFLLFIRRQEI